MDTATKATESIICISACIHTYIHACKHTYMYIHKYLHTHIRCDFDTLSIQSNICESLTPSVIAGVYSSGLHILRACIAGSRSLRIELVDRPVLRYRRSVILILYMYMCMYVRPITGMKTILLLLFYDVYCKLH